MSPFKQDILKILLDKLLLSLIAAGFGFYLSRLLEDYRTKNAYQLILSKERIDAYRKFLELITEHHHKVLALLKLLKDAREKGRALSEKEKAPGYEYISHHHDFQEQIYPLAAFLPQAVIAVFLSYLGEANKVARVIRAGDPQADLPDEENIEAAYLGLLVACTEAMASPS